jgi:hypothetical protein
MATFKLQRKLYADAVVQNEQQTVQQVPGAGSELRSAAIGTLAPMAITAGVNAVQNASKGTKATLIGGALAAGLGYAAHKGYLGSSAQKFTGNLVNQGKTFLSKFKPQQAIVNTIATTQQPVIMTANFDAQTGKPTATGFKNYKNLDPTAQARIRQENAARKQQKANQKTAKVQSIMQKKTA